MLSYYLFDDFALSWAKCVVAEILLENVFDMLQDSEVPPHLFRLMISQSYAV
jgi:hypothetical protein